MATAADDSGVPSRPSLLAAVALAATLILPAASLAGSKDPATAGGVTASEVTQNGARVTATVTLGDGDADYRFEYGTTPALGTWTQARRVTHAGDNSRHEVVVTQVLSGLPAGTLHHVRLMVDGAQGPDGYGPISTFTTVAAPVVTPTPTPGEPGTPAPSPSPTPSPSPDPDAGVAPSPKLGESAIAATEEGTVRVRLPGTGRFVALSETTSVPLGTVIDTTRGTLELRTALPSGELQSGTFWGARFKVSQPAAGGGRTDLRLRGGGLGACRTVAREARTVASVARTKPKRRLWGKDQGGRFRTHGRDSVATVRGTTWSVTDRCDGTVTKVAEGAVDVRDRHTGRVVRVDAGERHFAKHRR